MFTFFKKRLKINVISVIIAVLLVNYFFIIKMYSAVIEEDFSYKVEHFNNQYISNVDSKMTEIENQVQLFISKYYEALRSPERKPEITAALKKVKNYTYGIEDAFVLGGLYDYYDGTFLGFMAEERFKDKYLYQKNTGWTAYETKDGDALVLYVQNIKDTGLKVFVNVNAEIFRFWDTGNMFYNVLLTSVGFVNDKTCIADNNSEIFMVEDAEEIASEYINGAEHRTFKRKLCSDITLYSCISTQNLQRQFYRYHLVMAGVILVFLIIAWLCLRFMTNNIEKICTKIFNKFKDFPNEIKGGDIHV